MLWELSTPFVFMRWLLHSLGRHEGRLYMANGVAMIVVFFLCRNALGVGPPPALVRSAPCSCYAVRFCSYRQSGVARLCIWQCSPPLCLKAFAHSARMASKTSHGR